MLSLRGRLLQLRLAGRQAQTVDAPTRLGDRQCGLAAAVRQTGRLLGAIARRQRMGAAPHRTEVGPVDLEHPVIDGDRLAWFAIAQRLLGATHQLGDFPAPLPVADQHEADR